MIPETTIGDAIGVLKAEGIGALVVTSEGESVVGIISERDVVRGLAVHGTGLLAMCVADLMTRSVVTCTPESRVHELMKEMTVHHIRHLPVVHEEVLSGLVSIGDVVKIRLQELEAETNLLRDYITSG